MVAYVFASLAAAQACAAQVDVGVLAHPTLPEWAYMADPNTTYIVGPNAISLQLPAPVVLDATWADATPTVVVTDGATGALAQTLHAQGTVVVIP